MKANLKNHFCLILIIFFVFSSRTFAQGNPEREFIMSCTYGVLAGTLVGAALLAFEDDPGENLQQVARGASLGLYLGIGLGIYTAYILPKKIQNEENEILEEGIGFKKIELPRFMVLPIVADNELVGIGTIWNIAFF